MRKIVLGGAIENQFWSLVIQKYKKSHVQIVNQRLPRLNLHQSAVEIDMEASKHVYLIERTKSCQKK